MEGIIISRRALKKLKISLKPKEYNKMSVETFRLPGLIIDLLLNLLNKNQIDFW